MSWQTLPYTAVLLTAALISLIVIYSALRVRIPSRARSAFIIFMSGVTVWAVCYAMEVGNTTFLQKIIWTNLQYLGVLVIPPALLVFILSLTHQERLLTKFTWGLFISFTLIFLVLVFTDSSHHLLRQNLGFVSTPFPELVFDYGPVFQILLIYIYIFLLLSAVALIHHIMQSSAYYRGQAYALLIAMLFPWAGSVLEISGIGLIDHLSPVVFSFIISGGIYVWVLRRTHLLDILPLAQHAIFDYLPDGIIVLDPRLRATNLNPAVCQMLAIQEADMIGKSLSEIEPELVTILKARKPTELQFGRAPGKHYEVLVSDLAGPDSNLAGFMLVLREITQRKQMEAELRNRELQYRGVCEHANDGIAILQDDLIKYINPQLCEMLGLDTFEILNQGFIHLIAPKDRENALRRYQDRMNGLPSPTRYELALVHKNGAEFDIEVNASLIEFAGRTADLIFVRDITQQKHDREELLSKNRQLELILENANRLKNTAENRARELETLQRATRVLSSLGKREETIQHILEQLALVVAYDSAAVHLKQGDHLEVIGCRGFDDASGILGLQLPFDPSNPGALVFNSHQALALPDVQSITTRFSQPPHDLIHGWMGVPMLVQDQVIGLLSLHSPIVNYFTDEHINMATAFASQVAVVLENSRLFDEVQRLAITDPLTGLYNRRHFYSLVQQEFLHFQRYANPLSILMMDVDHFKVINDTYGHLAGDRVLQYLAGVFQENLRKVDIVCRFGGEEFIAALPETGKEGAMIIAERLRQKISQAEIPTESGRVMITASIGIAECGVSCSTLDHLLGLADTALYTAKVGGRDRVCWQKG
jgi:diguanylate cyclase (GGDEF)-like protein/PAS domain S-box-containing protein